MDAAIRLFNDFLSGTAAHPGTALVIFLSFLVAIALGLLSRRISLLTKGGDGKSLEGTIRALSARVERLEARALNAEKLLADANRRLLRAVQGVSVKRFDPFQGAGGQQSFASAFLDEKGNGTVLSGIHARDGVRVYAKEVKNFQSERELSEEEKGAIDEARSKL